MTDPDPLGDEALDAALKLSQLGWLTVSPANWDRMFCRLCTFRLDSWLSYELHLKKHCQPCTEYGKCSNMKGSTCQGH